MKQIAEIVNDARSFFDAGATRDVAWRRDALKRLHKAIRLHAEDIQAALHSDLGKNAAEAYMTEIGTTLSNISHLIKHVRRYSRVRRASAGLALFPSKGYIVPEPYGVVLVMSPWNYPFLLCVDPVAEAVAAGNTVVLKPSKSSPATAGVIARIFAEVFDPGHVAVVDGPGVGDVLLDQRFDYIFYTGSPRIGKLVMRKAAEHLTPVTLELGGKSPVIVDQSADVDMAAKRIVYGKMMNSGQTCIAPDYVLIHRGLKDAFVQAFKKYSLQFMGDDPAMSADYPRMVSREHFDRVRGYLSQGRVLAGGRACEQSLKMEPTLLEVSDLSVAVMQEEIFGPVLPLIEVDGLQQAVDIINGKESPLALYVFAGGKAAVRRVVREIRYGGGCINDTLMHIVSPDMPFGGVGGSGMGAYHGRRGFDTFTHYKSVLKTPVLFDNPLRYPPFGSGKMSLIKRFLQ